MIETKSYNGNPRLKRFGEVIRYTKKQIEEYKKCKEDIIYFAENYVKIVNLNEGLITISLYDYQKSILLAGKDHRYLALNCARQSAKTTTITIDILHFIIFNPHKTVAIISTKVATSREIFSRIQLAFENLPKFIQQGVVSWNKGSCELENGSKVICSSSAGSSIRGLSIDYLFVDECITGDSLVTVRDKKTGEISYVSVETLYDEMNTSKTKPRRFLNNSKYEILTKDGFKQFEGIKKTTTKKIIKITADNKSIKTTHNHEFDTPTGKIPADQLSLGTEIITNSKISKISKIEKMKSDEAVYDVIEVEGDHTYLANDFSVSNCAFIPNWDELWKSIFPTISSGKNSRVVLVSTPNGLNHFYKIIRDGKANKNEFQVVEVMWSDVPGRDEEWKRQTIANTSQEDFLQEHALHFTGNSKTLISSTKLRCLVEENPISSVNSTRIYTHAKENHVYVIPVDTSRGRGLDKSALSVIDITEYPFEQVATFYDDSISPLLYPSYIESIAKKYNDAHVLVETNDIGESVATTLYYDLEYENVIQPVVKGKSDIGIRTTKAVKSVGCSTMRDLIEQDMLIVHDKNTITELCGFIQKGASYEADSGFHDDLVMGLVLFSWLTIQPQFEDFRENFSLRKSLFTSEASNFDEDLMPAAYCSDGIEEIEERIIEDGEVWSTVEQLG